jgi:hypothetical protein
MRHQFVLLKSMLHLVQNQSKLIQLSTNLSNLHILCFLTFIQNHKLRFQMTRFHICLIDLLHCRGITFHLVVNLTYNCIHCLIILQGGSNTVPNIHIRSYWHAFTGSQIYQGCAQFIFHPHKSVCDRLLRVSYDLLQIREFGVQHMYVRTHSLPLLPRQGVSCAAP